MPETTTTNRVVVASRAGVPDVWFETELGRRQVHSRYDPEREAVRLLQELQLRDHDLVVICGNGLGYLQRALTASPLKLQLLIIEPDRDTAVTLGCTPVVSQRAELMIEPDYPKAVQRITRMQMKNGFCDVVLYINPAYAAAFPGFMAGITSTLRSGRNVSQFRRRSSLNTRTVIKKVLLLDTGYFLQAELARGLDELGMEQSTVTVSSRSFRMRPGNSRNRYEATHDFLPRLLERVAEFKPDLLLTVNHLGFDREGKLAALLEELRLPVAVWYVDSPTYILNGQFSGVSLTHHLFVWERSYLKALKENGFVNVTHLPLAGGHHMRPGQGPLRDRGLFVGSSNRSGITIWQDKPRLRLKREQEELLIAAQRAQPAVPIGQHFSVAGLTGDNRLLQCNSESLLVLQATRRERLELLQKLPVDVCGDDEWSRLLPLERHTLPAVDYYKELPQLYASYPLHLNQTSYQMNSAVNQRVFDVPLCGGLLVTDYREDLEQLFDIERECVVYHSHDEAADLLSWYLRKREQAARVAAVAADRVNTEHLYRHRLQTMMRILKSQSGEKE